MRCPVDVAGDANLSDADLVGRARCGDPAAFASLVDRHERAMLAVAYATTRCGPTAADVVQEAFVKCWRRLGELRDGERFAAWVATAVRHGASNARRSAGRRAMTVGAEVLDGRRRDESPDPLVERERLDGVGRAIAQLDETTAAVVTLRYYEGLPSKSIGELLGMSPAAVDMRLSRGRATLRGLLESVVSG